jgi:hypothetical protein
MVQMFVSISSLILSLLGFLIGDVLVFFDKPPSSVEPRRVGEERGSSTMELEDVAPDAAVGGLA